MIFPLGLGHRIIKVPIVTLFLILANIYCYFFFKSQVDLEHELKQAYENSHYLDEYVRGFVDFCQTSLEKETCEAYGEKQLKSIYDKKMKTLSESSEQTDSKKISGSDILKLTGLFVKYHTSLTNTPEELSDIKNFSQLMEAQERKLELLEELYFKYDFLSRNNFTPVTVFKAQFNHFDLFHLLGNMLFLFIFGLYVEHRVSKAPYLFFYIMGGTMGLLLQIYTFNPEHFLLGASANVYAVMGMFYALFYDKKMKFFIWYLTSRKVTVDVKYWLPALVFANEIIMSARDTSTFSDGVAHIAHVGGLFVGLVCGYFLREFSPLHKDFLYQFEVNEWRKAKKSGNAAQISDTAVRILSFNPFNDLVLEDYMSSLLDEFSKKPTAIEHLKITKQFPLYFKFCMNTKKYDELILTLNRLQTNCNIEALLRYRNLSDLVFIGDTCVEKNEYLLAITAYVAFIHSYPNSKLTLEVQKTVKNILEQMELSEFNTSVLKALASNSHNVFLKKLLFDSLQTNSKMTNEEAA